MTDLSNQVAKDGTALDAHTSTVGVMLRQGLTIVGSLLVAKGLVTTDQSAALVTALAGALPVIFSIGWSLLQKRQQKKVVAAALATPIPK